MTSVAASCPFCGCTSTATLKIITLQGTRGPYPTPDRTFVECGECKASGPAVETPHNYGEKVSTSVTLAAIA